MSRLTDRKFPEIDEEYAVVPDDFRMLGGNITRDFYDESIPSHAAVSFECVGDGFDSEHISLFVSPLSLPAPAILPWLILPVKTPWILNDRECPWIRPQIYFPSCWNGKDAYLPNNEHVAYPLDRFEGGACPEGFVHIPNLFMEAYYKVKGRSASLIM